MTDQDNVDDADQSDEKNSETLHVGTQTLLRATDVPDSLRPHAARRRTRDLVEGLHKASPRVIVKRVTVVPPSILTVSLLIMFVISILFGSYVDIILGLPPQGVSGGGPTPPWEFYKATVLLTGAGICTYVVTAVRSEAHDEAEPALVPRAIWEVYRDLKAQFLPQSDVRSIVTTTTFGDGPARYSIHLPTEATSETDILSQSEKVQPNLDDAASDLLSESGRVTQSTQNAATALTTDGSIPSPERTYRYNILTIKCTDPYDRLGQGVGIEQLSDEIGNTLTARDKIIRSNEDISPDYPVTSICSIGQYSHKTPPEGIISFARTHGSDGHFLRKWLAIKIPVRIAVWLAQLGAFIMDDAKEEPPEPKNNTTNHPEDGLFDEVNTTHLTEINVVVAQPEEGNPEALNCVTDKISNALGEQFGPEGVSVEAERQTGTLGGEPNRLTTALDTTEFYESSPTRNWAGKRGVIRVISLRLPDALTDRLPLRDTKRPFVADPDNLANLLAVSGDDRIVNQLDQDPSSHQPPTMGAEDAQMAAMDQEDVETMVEGASESADVESSDEGEASGGEWNPLLNNDDDAGDEGKPSDDGSNPLLGVSDEEQVADHERNRLLDGSDGGQTSDHERNRLLDDSGGMQSSNHERNRLLDDSDEEQSTGAERNRLLDDSDELQPSDDESTRLLDDSDEGQQSDDEGNRLLDDSDETDRTS